MTNCLLTLSVDPFGPIRRCLLLTKRSLLRTSEPIAMISHALSSSSTCTAYTTTHRLITTGPHRDYHWQWYHTPVNQPSQHYNVRHSHQTPPLVGQQLHNMLGVQMLLLTPLSNCNCSNAHVSWLQLLLLYWWTYLLLLHHYLVLLALWQVIFIKRIWMSKPCHHQAPAQPTGPYTHTQTDTQTHRPSPSYLCCWLSDFNWLFALHHCNQSSLIATVSQ